MEHLYLVDSTNRRNRIFRYIFIFSKGKSTWHETLQHNHLICLLKLILLAVLKTPVINAHETEKSFLLLLILPVTGKKLERDSGCLLKRLSKHFLITVQKKKQSYLLHFLKVRNSNNLHKIPTNEMGVFRLHNNRRLRVGISE